MSPSRFVRTALLLGSAGLVFGAAGCKWAREPIPTLRVEVSFVGGADMGRLSRVAEANYKSRRNTGFIFSHHDTRTEEVRFSVEGDRVWLEVPKYTRDEYDLEYLGLRFDTDLDRRLGVGPSALSFVPYPESWVPEQWPQDCDPGKRHSLGFYYEYSADGVFRSRRYYWGDFSEMLTSGWSSFYFSTLENTRALELTIDFHTPPYFENVEQEPVLALPLELPGQKTTGGEGGATSTGVGEGHASRDPSHPPPRADDNRQTRRLTLELGDFERQQPAELRIAAVDSDQKLLFWDGENLYPFAGDWSVMRPTDFTQLQQSAIHQRASVEVLSQSLRDAPDNLRLPDAGLGELTWSYVEGQQLTHFVVGLQHEGLVFVRRVP